MSDLSRYLAAEKKRFLHGRETDGGKAPEFRDRIRQQYTNNPDQFNMLVLDALMEATTKKWEEQPRRGGPDLFSIAGYDVPEYLTRPSVDYDSGENEDIEYEKVDQEFATVNDFLEDATIKLRKAAQAGTAAERAMKAVDEARRRARGNMTVFLRDIAD